MEFHEMPFMQSGVLHVDGWRDGRTDR